MHTVGLLFVQTTNHGSKTVQVFIEKKSVYEGIHTVQTRVVQGSTVLSITT